MNLNNHEKKKIRFPLYVVKRMDLVAWKYWLLRVGSILLAFLAAGIICTILRPGTFGLFYTELIRGCFDFSDISSIMDLFIKFSVLLVIAIALTPAFKMKFWNIGAEGQILIGAMAAAGVAYFSKGMPNILILILAAIAGTIAGVVWSVIPGIFKAFFNTNETLFTLMLNYVAMIASTLAISVWIKSGSQSFGILKQGVFPDIFDNSGTLVIPFALVIFTLMFLYIKKSKEGYELTVVGESLDTARYIGINVRFTIIRTMILCGAICGFLGFMIVCGVHQTFNSTIVEGKGFTGVLIAWLGHFEPLEIALYSFVAAIMEQGTSIASTTVGMSAYSSEFSAICTGVFFFIVIAFEFFSRYKVKVHHKQKEEVANI